MIPSDATQLSLRWRRAVRSLDGGLRAAYLNAESRSYPIALIAEALDAVCTAAEQAEPDARELLVSVVDWLSQQDQLLFAQKLREEAVSASRLALGRLVRQAGGGGASLAPVGALGAPVVASGSVGASWEARIPDYGKGRPLTLGERKALARRPTRQSMEKLFADPHPVVIRTLLANPKVTEDDVVRLAARRPGSAEVLAEIARAKSWARRVRVRMALVLNPDAPLELATLLLALLDRTQLTQVATSAYLAKPLRAAALELLARRPPVRMGGSDPENLQ